jgi:hypothetical protein
MKFFSWITTILIIAVIIAAFTAPGDKKFANFISEDKGGDTMACKPIIGKTRYAKILFVKLFSFHNVSYCEIRKTPSGKLGIRLAPKNEGSDSVAVAIGKISIPKITHSETYLGLFGRFWKL